MTDIRRWSHWPGNLNRSLVAACAPIWQHTSYIDQFTAFGAFLEFFEWKGYYGEQFHEDDDWAGRLVLSD